jgi:hypothetical protein
MSATGIASAREVFRRVLGLCWMPLALAVSHCSGIDDRQLGVAGSSRIEPSDGVTGPGSGQMDGGAGAVGAMPVGAMPVGAMPVGGALGLLTLDASALDFGSVAEGARATRVLTFRRAGGGIQVPPSSVTGEHAGDFMLAPPSCDVTASACPVEVGFSPGDIGARAAALTFQSEPPLTVALAGVGLRSGSLALRALGAPDFGGVLVGQSAELSFEVSNPGTMDSGPLSIALEGQAFALRPATGSDCVQGFTSIANAGTCSIRVGFEPSQPGLYAATLTLNSPGAGAASLGVTGTGLAPGELSSGATAHDFGGVEVMGNGVQFSWVLENTGALEIVPGQLTSTNSDDFLIDNRCIEPVAAGGSCAVLVTFRPVVSGTRNASLRLYGDAGRFVELLVVGSGLVRVTVQRNGVGRVTSDPPGIDCGPTCNALFDPSRPLQLRARTTNGSNAFFSGWSEGACEEPTQDCTVPPDAWGTVSATFSPMLNNLVFVSSAVVATNLGSLAAYDAVCNQLASDAGINDAAGNGYLAGMSTSTTDLRDRIPAAAQGWVRLDGLPFATSSSELFVRQNVLNPVGFNEVGRRESAYSAGPEKRVMTGTRADGTAEPDATCADWTIGSAQANTQQGLPGTGGPSLWTTGIPIACNIVPYQIHCLGRTKTTPVAVPTRSGKRAWLSNTPFIPGSMTPDAKCTSERPLGVSQGRALLPYTDRGAGAVLDPNANYVRPDGQLVGTGQQIIDQELVSGIWIHANGSIETQFLSRVWAGNRDFESPLTADVTCGNWTSVAQTGYAGYAQEVDISFYGFGIPVPCDSTSTYVYCVEP